MKVGELDWKKSYNFDKNGLLLQMGISEYHKTNIRYGDSQKTNTARYLILVQLCIDRFLHSTAGLHVFFFIWIGVLNQWFA